MNIKRFILAVIAVYIALGIVATLVNGVFLVDYYQPFMDLGRSRADRAAMMPWELIGHLIQVVLFCYIFLKGYENKGVAEGVRYGLLIGLLFAGTDLVLYAALPLPLATALVWTITDVALWVIGGAVLACVYKPKPLRM